MEVVQPKVDEIVFFVPESGEDGEKLLERIGRISHKSEGNICYGSEKKFIKKLRKLKHGAALEFGYFLAFLTCDRGCSHELVRHRLASFLQESTRYCGYFMDKFLGEITVIDQPSLKDENRNLWEMAMRFSEWYYMQLKKKGEPNDVARSVLPIGLKTEIVIGANLREWMHIFNMRCPTSAHEIIRGITRQILVEAVKRYPSLYADEYQRFYPVDEEAA